MEIPKSQTEKPVGTKEKLYRKLTQSKVIIFGLDGNLINSIPIHLATAEEIFRSEIENESTKKMPSGYYSTLYRTTRGLPTDKQFKIAFKEVRGSEPDRQVAKDFETRFNRQVAEKTSSAPLMPGVESFLRDFRQRPAKPLLVVSTSHNITDIPELIKGTGLDNYLDVVLAQGGVYKKTNGGWQIELEGEDFKKGKPYFDYLKQRYNLTIEDMVYIASAPADIGKSKTEGVYTVGLGQAIDIDEIKKKKPDYIFSSFVKLFEQSRRRESGEIESKAKVLIIGTFGEREVIGITLDEKKKPDAGLDQRIEPKWQEILRKTPKTFPGSMYRVSNWQLKEGQIVLDLGLTDYREYVGTRELSDLRSYGYEALSNPIGVSTAVITGDNKLVIAKRLSGEKVGYIDVIGGAVSPREDFIDGKVDFFHTAKRELVEELNFENTEDLEKHLSEIKCLGLVYEYAGLCHPQLIFIAELNLPSDEIKKRISEEIEPVIINLDKNSPTLEEVLKSFYPNIEPDGRIAMALSRKFERGKNYSKRLLRTPQQV